MVKNENIIIVSETLKIIKSGNNVFIYSAAVVPKHLINAMTNRHSELRDIYQIHTEGETPYANPDLLHHLPLNRFLSVQIHQSSKLF